MFFAKDFKLAMPAPEIPHSIPLNALSLARQFALDFGVAIALGLSQKSRPNALSSENTYKLNSLTLSDPEPAVDDEPRRHQSFGGALHLRDDFLRDRPWSFFIARKVHRVFRAPLRRRTHVRRVAKHFRQWNNRLNNL